MLSHWQRLLRRRQMRTDGSQTEHRRKARHSAASALGACKGRPVPQADCAHAGRAAAKRTGSPLRRAPCRGIGKKAVVLPGLSQSEEEIGRVNMSFYHFAPRCQEIVEVARPRDRLGALPSGRGALRPRPSGCGAPCRLVARVRSHFAAFLARFIRKLRVEHCRLPALEQARGHNVFAALHDGTSRA